MNEFWVTVSKNIGNCYILQKTKKKIGTGLGFTLLLFLLIFSQIGKPKRHLQKLYIGGFWKNRSLLLVANSLTTLWRVIVERNFNFYHFDSRQRQIFFKMVSNLHSIFAGSFINTTTISRQLWEYFIASYV